MHGFPPLGVCRCMCVCVWTVGSLACVQPLRHGPGLCGCPGATIVPGFHSPVATDVPCLIPCSSHTHTYNTPPPLPQTCGWPNRAPCCVPHSHTIGRLVPARDRGRGEAICMYIFNPVTVQNEREVAPSGEKASARGGVPKRIMGRQCERIEEHKNVAQSSLMKTR